MKSNNPTFVVCIENEGADDLTKWKLYRRLPDAEAARSQWIRIVDDSGEEGVGARHFYGVKFEQLAHRRPGREIDLRAEDGAGCGEALTKELDVWLGNEPGIGETIVF